MKDRIFKMLEGITLLFVLAAIAYHSGLLTFRSKEGWSELREIVSSIWSETIPAERIPEELQKIPDLFMFHWSAVTGIRLIVFLLLYVLILTMLRKFILWFEWKWCVGIWEGIVVFFRKMRTGIGKLMLLCSQLDTILTALCYGVFPAAYQNRTISIIYEAENTVYVWASARSERKKCCRRMSKLPMLGMDGSSRVMQFPCTPRLWCSRSGEVILTTCGKEIHDENGAAVSRISFDCGEERTIKIGSTMLTIKTEEES